MFSGLKVAMQHALPVRGVNGSTHRGQDPQRPVDLEPALALPHAAQILSPDQFHHEKGAAVDERSIVKD